MANTSATGGYLVPEQGMTRHELEELLRTVCSGCTGIKRINVRTKWKAEPDNIPKKAETWLSFAIMSRESPKAQVLHLETLDGEGSSRVMTHETIEVLTSFFGPDAEPGGALPGRRGLRTRRERHDDAGTCRLRLEAPRRHDADLPPRSEKELRHR